MKCRVRFYGYEVDGQGWPFVCGVFGKNQRFGWLAGGSERHADEGPARCAGGKEQIVASVFTAIGEVHLLELEGR